MKIQSENFELRASEPIMNMINVRFANAEDLAGIVELCRAHAEFEQSPYDAKGKIEGLAEDIFSVKPKLFCLVVAYGSKLLGYATYMKQYATWEAAEYVYMDCLFIKEEFRSQGHGEKLVKRIKEESSLLGCSLIQWQTPIFNTRAMKFYKRIGAYSKTKERFFLNITNDESN